jgi:hypothetical protein
MERRRLDAHGRSDTGATLVEFVLVAPVVFIMIFGIIAGCYLAFQNSALHDGATAGSRMASIETSLETLQTSGPMQGSYCESGSPVPIEKAVAQAAPLLPVNPNPLCATSQTAMALTQTAVNGDVNITVTCSGSEGCLSPTTTAVSLALTTGGLVAPFGLTYNMSATSEVPVESP